MHFVIQIRKLRHLYHSICNENKFPFRMWSMIQLIIDFKYSRVQVPGKASVNRCKYIPVSSKPLHSRINQEFTMIITSSIDENEMIDELSELRAAGTKWPRSILWNIKNHIMNFRREWKILQGGLSISNRNTDSVKLEGELSKCKCKSNRWNPSI